MPEFTHDPEMEPVLDNLMAGMPHVTKGKMFGYPGYKVNGKLAVGLFDVGLTAKVGAEKAQEVIGQPGVQAFEPMPGRVWKDWVHIVEDNLDDYAKHRALYEFAVQYVAENG
ncbi:MAG: hypothetical protein D6737_03620 [Chloroflexi bacterium]|nr:MAG: hypothetical protein D6737_03620 [Chloroflexota bacterium]